MTNIGYPTRTRKKNGTYLTEKWAPVDITVRRGKILLYSIFFNYGGKLCSRSNLQRHYYFKDIVSRKRDSN